MSILIVLTTIISLVQGWYGGMRLKRIPAAGPQEYLTHYKPNLDGSLIKILLKQIDAGRVYWKFANPMNAKAQHMRLRHLDGAFFVHETHSAAAGVAVTTYQIILDITSDAGPIYKISIHPTPDGYISAASFGDLDNYNIYMVHKTHITGAKAKPFWIQQGLDLKCTYYSILELFQGYVIEPKEMNKAHIKQMEEQDSSKIAKYFAKRFPGAWSQHTMESVISKLGVTTRVYLKTEKGNKNTNGKKSAHSIHEVAKGSPYSEFMGVIVLTKTHAFCMRKVGDFYWNLDTGFVNKIKEPTQFKSYDEFRDTLMKMYNHGHTILVIMRKIEHAMEDPYNKNKNMYQHRKKARKNAIVGHDLTSKRKMALGSVELEKTMQKKDGKQGTKNMILWELVVLFLICGFGTCCFCGLIVGCIAKEVHDNKCFMNYF